MSQRLYGGLDGEGIGLPGVSPGLVDGGGELEPLLGEWHPDWHNSWQWVVTRLVP